jgi:hypothetical protein
LIPAGELVTTPAPTVVTLSVTGGIVNPAVTVLLTSIVTVHVVIPLHPPPLHPRNDDPPVGAAVNVTVEPELNVAAQVVPQLIPVGALVTVPVPLPDLEIVRVGLPSNIAVAV